MRIANNIMALNAHRHLIMQYHGMARAMEQLASGLRINRAADDPAGLAISQRMRGQIGGLRQAIRNAQDGISLLQTAEGALGASHDMLHRLRELAVQAASDTYTEADRAHMQREIDGLVAELTRIGDTTEFNTMRLLDGSYEGKKIHIGANAGQHVEVNIADMRAEALGVQGLSVMTREDADEAIAAADRAIQAVSSERASLGAMQNRLEHTVANLSTTAENLQAAESRIRDADIAAVVMELIRRQIMMQAATAMLAQANLSAQIVLQLLP